MATILPFQLRDRHCAPQQRNTVPQDLAEDDHEEALRASDRFGEIVLFTGVRYSRWEEQTSDAGAELAPAE
jgi:hypothetical protein